MIPDDEIVHRRIPCAATWFEAPGTITSANFKLDRRRGDLGLSVYRASIVSSQEVLAKPAATPNSMVVSVAVSKALRDLFAGRATGGLASA